LKFLGFLNQG